MMRRSENVTIEKKTPQLISTTMSLRVGEISVTPGTRGGEKSTQTLTRTLAGWFPPARLSSTITYRPGRRTW